MKKTNKSVLHGVLLILLFAMAAFYIGEMDFVKSLSFSPMIVGIVLGMIYANTLRNDLPESWSPGIQFCSKKILRIGIIFYGFRLTLQDVTQVGLPAICVDALIVVTTIFGGVMIGKMLKMDKEIALLTSIGSSICGAAAILGAESALRVKPYKTAVAVSTVVIFGTIAMFLYPVLYRNGLFDDANLMGMFTGATVHEVAHVVGAGNAMGEQVGSVGIIVKMIRVMMLVPVLLVISYTIARKGSSSDGKKGKIQTPWFAILFLVMICFNSLNLLPQGVVDWINNADTFLLTMAMTALGAETSFEKFKKAGLKPFVLALILFFWLIVGGYCICRYLVPIMM